MRLIEVVADAGHADSIAGIAEQNEVTDIWAGAVGEDGRQGIRLLVRDDCRQAVMNALQTQLGAAENARIVVLPVDVALPREDMAKEEDARLRQAVVATREELYEQIDRGARTDSNFLVLTVLSTLVAAVGLLEDNVAVVVGAMVIAPLLGPNIALAFAVSLGDRRLLGHAARTSFTGLALVFSISVAMGLLLPVPIETAEIAARTNVNLGGVALALASGAAAVLSLTTGLSSTLVGVMVAVALLPPLASCGMLLGDGQLPAAAGAALLLAVNIVCVILSAMAVFRLKGVQPRTWLEKRKASQSGVLFGTGLFLLLVLLVTIILVRSATAETPGSPADAASRPHPEAIP